MLESRLRIGSRVFEMSESTLQHQHQDLRDKLGLDSEFVLHSLRHTMLTRLGEAGVDPFTIRYRSVKSFAGVVEWQTQRT